MSAPPPEVRIPDQIGLASPTSSRQDPDANVGGTADSDTVMSPLRLMANSHFTGRLAEVDEPARAAFWDARDRIRELPTYAKTWSGD